MNSHYNIVIVGGGVIGAACARALATLPLRIAMVEAVEKSVVIDANDYDARSIGLTRASQQLLQSLGLWQALSAHATPLQHIHVSDQGHFGAVRLHAADHDLETFGYVVGMCYLQQALQQALQQQENLQLFCPASVQALQQQETGVTVTLHDGRQLHTSLVIAADGQRSSIRQLLDIAATEWNYQQQAVIANISFSERNRATAYERFTATGPLAILPQRGNRCGLVWTIKQQQVDAVKALSDTDFIAAVQDKFGYRLGCITQLGQRQMYPLSMVKAQQSIAARTVFIGNAAQSLHPVAAQTMNVGLQDMATLVNLLHDALAQGQDIGAAALLQDYQRRRKREQKRMIAFTDGLVRLFSNRFTPLVVLRNLGLLGMDLLPPLKQQLVAKMAHNKHTHITGSTI